MLTTCYIACTHLGLIYTPVIQPISKHIELSGDWPSPFCSFLAPSPSTTPRHLKVCKIYKQTPNTAIFNDQWTWSASTQTGFVNDHYNLKCPWKMKQQNKSHAFCTTNCQLSYLQNKFHFSCPVLITAQLILWCEQTEAISCCARVPEFARFRVLLRFLTNVGQNSPTSIAVIVAVDCKQMVTILRGGLLAENKKLILLKLQAKRCPLSTHHPVMWITLNCEVQ